MISHYYIMLIGDQSDAEDFILRQSQGETNNLTVLSQLYSSTTDQDSSNLGKRIFYTYLLRSFILLLYQFSINACARENLI